MQLFLRLLGCDRFLAQLVVNLLELLQTLLELLVLSGQTVLLLPLKLFFYLLLFLFIGGLGGREVFLLGQCLHFLIFNLVE